MSMKVSKSMFDSNHSFAFECIPKLLIRTSHFNKSQCEVFAHYIDFECEAKFISNVKLSVEFFFKHKEFLKSRKSK